MQEHSPTFSGQACGVCREDGLSITREIGTDHNDYVALRFKDHFPNQVDRSCIDPHFLSDEIVERRVDCCQCEGIKRSAVSMNEVRRGLACQIYRLFVYTNERSPAGSNSLPDLLRGITLLLFWFTTDENNGFCVTYVLVRAERHTQIAEEWLQVVCI